MPDFSPNQQKSSLLLKNKPKSSNTLLEMVDAISNKTGSNKDIITPNAKAADVAKNVAAANNPSETANVDATTTGALTDITPAAGTTGVSSGMDVKTKDGDKKRYQLGFSLSGYKSIIQNNNSQQNANRVGFGGFDEGNIKWVVSCFGAGESSTDGFKQCKWNVSGDGYGWTVGGWSITQRGNFKLLGEYMKNANFSPDICNTIINSDASKSSKDTYNSYKTINGIDELLKRLTNTNGR